MSETLSGFHFESGTGNYYADHVVTQEVARPNGDTLTVALVADGGKRDAQRGKQIAQIAVKSTLTYLKHGAETDIPDLLQKAVQSANHAVQIFATLQKSPDPDYVPDPLCTLAIALIHNNDTLFVANVGCSRIYLLRDTRLTQLTLDHSFKNLNVTLGKIDLQTANANPNANVSIRSLGDGPELSVDLGFHINPSLNMKSYGLAQTRGKKGLPLQAGDAILVCSDGLYRNQYGRNQTLIEDEEIVQVLASQEGEKAARGLVSFALGRDGVDSISAAVLQIANPAKVAAPVNKARQIRKRTALVFASITAAFLTLYFVGAYFFSQRIETTSTPVAIVALAEPTELNNQSVAKLSALEAELISAKEQATIDYANEIRATQTVAAIIAATETARPTATLIPTATPRPTLEPGQIGIFRLRNAETAQNIREDEAIFATDIGEFQINHQGIDAEDASIYVQPESEIEFSEVARQVEFRLFEESDILIETGLYSSGTEIELRAEDDDLMISASDACLSVQFSAVKNEVVAMCFRGACEYKIGRNEAQSIPRGQRFEFDPSDFSIEPKTRRIGQADSIWYEELLGNFASGERDVNRCLRGYLPPPATITPTPTIFVASPTPEPTDEPRRNNGSSLNNDGNSDPEENSSNIGNNSEPVAVQSTAAPTEPRPAVASPTSEPEPVLATDTPEPDVPAYSTPKPTATRTVAPTKTVQPTKTAVPPTATQRPTKTAVLPTATTRPTHTLIPPTATFEPTNTLIPSTETPRPTSTAVPPTATVAPTNTSAPPTKTQVPPTNTSVPPTAIPQPTSTPVPPPTITPLPPTAQPTNTPVPQPTSTPLPPEPTQEPEPTEVPKPTDEPKPTKEPKATKVPKPTNEPKPTKEP